MKLSKLFFNPFFLAFLVGILSLHIIKHFALMRRSAPEPMVTVPEWKLTDQNGQTFGKNDLKGKLFIVYYFFTSCPSICPELTIAMKQVNDRLQKHGDRVHFVGISVDPETDTPEVLKRFMKTEALENPNWHYLTGTKPEIYDVVVEKMRVHIGEKKPVTMNGQGLYDVAHLAQLALFDQEGDLRGLFRTDSMELSALVRAADFLLESKS